MKNKFNMKTTLGAALAITLLVASANSSARWHKAGADAGHGHADMKGMDHSNMKGMDHSKMSACELEMMNMDHSKMSASDHSSMKKCDSDKDAVDHSDMKGMDHSKMDMPMDDHHKDGTGSHGH